MSVGNWREHILVKCKECKKLMGFHVVTCEATCVECGIKKRSIDNGVINNKTTSKQN